MLNRRCMFKQYLIVFIGWILSFGISLAASSFSNVIFFGDSLSDMGNFPMAKYPYLQTQLPPSLFNLYGMFYVPVSNPVNLAGYKLSIVKLFQLNRRPYQWPSVSKQLSAMIPTIDGKARKNRSYSWTEFFVSDAYQDGVLQTQRIVPSMLLQQRGLKLPVNYSVDYAFANATSNAGCNFRYDFASFGACSYDEIVEASQKYEKDPTLDKYNYILVPGLLEQINLFQADVHLHRVKVNNNTLYVIWIGGNDLLKDIQLFHSPLWQQKLVGLRNIENELVLNNQRAIMTLINSPEINAKNIVIFGSFNPVSVVPSMHQMNWLERSVISAVIKYYNTQLQKCIKRIAKANPEMHLQFEPAAIWFSQMANPKSPYSKVFAADKIGQACQLEDSAYNDAETPKQNCQGYLFWNAVHPSSSVEQILGYLVDKNVERF